MIPEIPTMTDRFFCHFRLFFVLLRTPNNLKNQNFEKMKEKKKKKETLSLYICVPYITIILHYYIEILSKTDRIFCNLGPVFALLPP